MKTEVECQLHTKASEELEISVARDLEQADRSIAELLNENEESSDDDRDSREGDTGE